MNNLLKLAIPLLNDKLTLEDIQEDSGFVGAYFEDINKPALNNHIFLMYDAEAKGSKAAKTSHKLYNLDNRYGFRVAYIKGKPYCIYSFTTNGTINRLRDGVIFLNEKQKEKILKFWDFKDGWVINNVLLGTIYETPTDSKLPEEDYAPEFTLNEEGEVLENEYFPFCVNETVYNNTADSQSLIRKFATIF